MVERGPSGFSFLIVFKRAATQFPESKMPDCAAQMRRSLDKMSGAFS
jgi:hypothetical protein